MSGSKIIELENNSAPAPVANNEEKWQQIVLYYLARLKGLCDWRSSSHSRAKPNQKMHLKPCSSQELESRIIDKVTHKPVSRLSRNQHSLDENDIGCYMAAGYEEGKQQAVKIISRSLRYGVMTGILLKRGNCYRIAPEYLCDDTVPVQKKKNVMHQKKECDTCVTRHKLSVKCVKANVRKKENKKRNAKKTSSKSKSIAHKKSSVTVKGKKRKRTSNNNTYVKNNINNATTKQGIKRVYNNDSDENPSTIKRNKRSSDTNIQPNESSNSATSISRSITPIDDRHNKRDVKAKRPRPNIQKPINYVPPLKKPRTKSQSKSPSHHTDDDYVVDKQNAKNKWKIINKFRMPRPHRYSDVISSMSSSSLSSLCTLCENEKTKAIKRTRHK